MSQISNILNDSRGKVKVNLSPCINWTPRHGGILGRGCSFTHSWLRHWMEVSGQIHAPATLPPEKEPLVPLR